MGFRLLLIFLFFLGSPLQAQTFSEEKLLKLTRHKVVLITRNSSDLENSGFFVDVPAAKSPKLRGLYFVTAASSLGQPQDDVPYGAPMAENVRFDKSIFLDNINLGPELPKGQRRRIELPLEKIYYNTSNSVVMIPIDSQKRAELFPRGDRGMIFQISPNADGRMAVGEKLFGLGYAIRIHEKGPVSLPFVNRSNYLKAAKGGIYTDRVSRASGKPLFDPKNVDPIELNTIKFFEYTHPLRALDMGSAGGPLLDSQGRVVGMQAYIVMDRRFNYSKIDPVKQFHLLPPVQYHSPLLHYVLQFPKEMEIFHDASKLAPRAPAGTLNSLDEGLQRLKLGAEGKDIDVEDGADQPLSNPDPLPPRRQDKEGPKNNEKVKPVL